MNTNLAERTFVLLALASVAGCSPSVKPEAMTQSAASSPAGPANDSQSPSSTPPASRGNSAPPTVASKGEPAKQAKSPTLDELLLFYPTRYPDGDWKPNGLSFEGTPSQVEMTAASAQG